MTPPITHYVGQLDPSLTDTLTVETAPGTHSALDLTGKTVKLKMRLRPSDTLKVDRAATIVGSPTAGAIRFDWQAADLDTAGEYVAWWEVTTTATSKPIHSPEFGLVVREHDAVRPGLVDVQSVREYLGLGGDDRAKDTVLEALIRRATRAIERYIDREIAPETATTKRIRVDLHRGNGAAWVDLSGYYLRSATSVSLHPESGSPTTLAADVDYALAPLGGGPYTALMVSATTSLASEYGTRFGYALLDITGNWGLDPVPDDLVQACVLTVKRWVRRDVSQLPQTVDADTEGTGAEGADSLPVDAMRLLTPWRRWAVA